MPSLEIGQKEKPKDNLRDELRRVLKKPRLATLAPELVPDKCFHVTYAKHLDSIKREGLNPRFGGTGASEGVPEMEAQSKGFMHVSKNKENAIEYKRTLLAINPSDKIVVLRLNISKKDNWHADPDDSSAIKTTEKIPLEDISIFTILNGKGKFIPLARLEQHKDITGFKYQFNNND